MQAVKPHVGTNLETPPTWPRSFGRICERMGSIRTARWPGCLQSTGRSCHPKTVNVRQEHIVRPLNYWIGQLFAPPNVDRTIAQLFGAQDGPRHADRARQQAQQRLSSAETRLRRHQAAIEAGVDPAALVDTINEAQRERAGALAELQHAPETTQVGEAVLRKSIETLGDVGTALERGEPEMLAQLYADLQLELVYQPQERAVTASCLPRVANVGVRRGT